LEPSSIYLEEELSKHDEFPVDGRFTIGYGRYEVHGDPGNERIEALSISQQQPRPWSTP
jgi:hypothetical protein